MKKFFQDPSGKFSMMRLKTLLLALVGMFIAIWQVCNNYDIDHALILEFIGLSLGAKIWQKDQELKNTSP